MSHGHAVNRAKPGTITAVQVIMWVKVGLMGLVLCGGLALMSEIGSVAEGAELVVLALFILVFYAIVFTVIAVNIPKGRNWARLLAIVVEAINLVVTPFLLSYTADSNAAGSVVGIAVSIAVIACAAHGSARQYCQETSH